MTEKPSESEWPPYAIPSKDILVALGVVSVKFNVLEMMLLVLFGVVTAIPESIRSTIFSRLNQEARIELLQVALKARKWPEPVSNRIDQFIAAFNACAASRHVLMHSAQAEGDEPHLFKFSKKGSLQSAKPTLADIRQTADDMNAWTMFAAHLLGALMRNGQEDGSFAERIPWPDIPTQPQNLSHKFLSAQA